uniref:Uncharacterized protein n=1 Tax=Arundo donax TaxID=35708 RepID=A0A0A9G9P7_ARUDO
MDEWDARPDAISSDDLDAYLEWLRKKVVLAEEGNRKVSDEIAAAEETTANNMIQLDVDIEALESSLSKLDSEGLNHFEESPIVGLSDWTDSCRSQSIVDKDYTYEVLQLDYQIRKSEMDLKLLQNLQRVEAMCQLESMLLPSLGKVLDFKDNCLRVFLKASILTSDCVVYGQKMDCVVDQLISDHELLIEVDENMEPKKVQVIL